jgi:hypothetical protein
LAISSPTALTVTALEAAACLYSSERRVRRVPSIEELRNEIVSLEERALYMADLANCLPDHQDWLWRAHDHLRSEVERRRRLLLLRCAHADSSRSAGLQPGPMRYTSACAKGATGRFGMAGSTHSMSPLDDPK